MTAAAAFAAGGLAIALLCVLLAIAIVLRRGLRQRSVRRRIALADPYRPLLVAVVADEGRDAAHVERLLALDDEVWKALEPVVVSMVRKLRGGARAALVELLHRRGTIERLTRRLHSPGAVGRARAAELLGLLGAHAPRAELELLLEHDRDPEVRIVAARALGEIGDPASTKILVRSVAGPHPVPMRIVARSLARLGPGAAPVLVTAMGAQVPAVRAVSAEILGLGGAVTAVSVLANHALHDPDDDVRIRCARALGRIGVPTGLAVLERCVRPTEPVALRAVAARAIGEVGGRQAVDLLEPLLVDDEHRVASNAARALGRLGDRAVERLRVVAAGGGPGAVYAAESLAMNALASAGPARAGLSVVPAQVQAIASAMVSDVVR
ncbi:HEAT repeat domain-containing protein [Angustibacter sp. McL0619]|uniref:HEAT repeat domain-containing protein n=1 Tax=Angustibacter sp. McL0619 TaxID=3415676 RepID=UPI003CED5C8E